MHECGPRHLRMETVRLKYDKETEEEGKQKSVKMERSTVGTTIRNPDDITIARAKRPPWGCSSPRQWMNCLTNLTLHLDVINYPQGCVIIVRFRCDSVTIAIK